MEMSGDAFNHWIVSINDLVMNLIEEVLTYTNATDINPSIFKKNIDNYVNNKLQDDYIIKRQFVEQGMKNLKLNKRTYTKTDWITSLEYGLQLNDTIFISMFIDVDKFKMKITNKMFDINTLEELIMTDEDDKSINEKLESIYKIVNRLYNK